MSSPWIKFYPRDWRGDQALRVVSLAARGLWMEMLSIMHEASPYGHLMVGAKPLEVDVLARMSGAGTQEVQVLLVELQDAGVFSRTRNGVITSRRMIADHKRSIDGRKAKLEAIEKAKGKDDPSRSATSPPTTQKPEARAKVEGPNSPSTLSEAKDRFLGPKEVRQAFEAELGDEWCRSYLDPCAWQDVPERALIPATKTAGQKLVREGRSVLGKLNLTVLERAA
jgi:hypothetical protein